ncbi:uncharacterized protein LOC144651218 [Oculina patagonica]
MLQRKVATRGLFDFSFSLSSKYEMVSTSTSKGETVYRDCTEICNKGAARYRLGEVQVKGWTLTDEFAYSVCQLPIRYRSGDEYFQFLEDWGTHVVIKVILGTKEITRFRSTLQEFMNFASENASNSVSMSAGYAGVSAEFSVDVTKFEESEETNKDFGEEQLSYKIGGDDFPEPIQLELMSIEETLDPKFWGNLDELKNKPRSPCKKMISVKLPKQKRNIIKAIKEYPGRMKVKRAKDNPMKLRLAWPAGYYSLYTAKTSGAKVCPKETGFQWSEGSVTERNRFFWPEPSSNTFSGIAFESFSDRSGVKFSFCSKTENPSSEYFSPQWPKGRYCILRKSTDPGHGQCPPNFEVAYVKWNDEGLESFAGEERQSPIKSGEVPDGEYQFRDYMVITYCCRRDAFYSKGIHLPIDNPFILSNIAGNPCQKVCGAKDTQLSFRTVFSKFLRKEYPSTITGSIKPAGSIFDHELELSYCYYEKMDDANFVTYKFFKKAVMARTAERKCVEEKGHLVSIHSRQENDIVKNKMGNNARAWIGLKRRTVQNKPWIWYDGTEVDFGDWEPDVTDDQHNYVSMSKNGSWEAQVNNVKLPFVCKIINDCPMSS